MKLFINSNESFYGGCTGNWQDVLKGYYPLYCGETYLWAETWETSADGSKK